MSPTIHPNVLETREVIQNMLTENTGRHMLDSGGAYGRNWERNQGRDFAFEPAAVADWSWGYVDITVSLYHALTEVLEYHPEGDALFHRWATTGDRTNEPWLPLMEAFAVDIGGVGLYGDGAPITENSYNGESMLSQVIQYVMFTLEEDTPISDYLDLGLTDEEDAEPAVLAADTYILLQVHGGCDVRGGYTAPRLFALDAYDEAEWFDVGRQASIFCNDCHAAWHTYEVNYFQASEHEEHNFEDYEWIDLTDPKQLARWTANRIVAESAIDLGWEDEHRPLGIGYYHYPSDKNIALCPHCGTGELGVQGQ